MRTFPSAPTLRRTTVAFACAAAWLGLNVTALAGDEAAVDALPPNLGHGLRQLIVWHRAQPAHLSATERRTRLTQALPARARRVQINADATVATVSVMLDGKVPLANVRAGLTALGAEVLAANDTGRAGSTVSARLPLDQAVAAARVPGVFSLVLAHAPWKHLGKATSQGVGVLKADAVNRLGYDGTGITVGVISDSFDKAAVASTDYPPATRASDDVTNGDLPGPGNPFGHLEAVHLIQEAVPGDYGGDEGRAMLQIIHDVAPGARLAFHRAGTTSEELAEAVTALASQTTFPCDVIVDDFGYPDEPFFSDGPVAQATTRAASPLASDHPAVYFSSAGNSGDAAYGADFVPVGDAAARAGTGRGNLRLDQVPAALTTGGFHNFNPQAGKVTLAQKIKVYADAEISFQWDDPFIPYLLTTDYNLLVFDAAGNYLAKVSGTDQNRATGKALEIVNLPLADGAKSTTYQLVIAQAAGGGAATHLHYVVNGGDAVIHFRGYNQASAFGHNAGGSVIGVAAYAYDHLQEPEAFSSLGPVPIYFDAAGNRLATPEIRRQPAVAATDGVDTSFFPLGPLKDDGTYKGTDTDGDSLPNFYGTSAAAPHAAAVAALLLQAAGGSGSLTAVQVQNLLQSTALAHDLDPNHVSASLSPGDGSTVTLAVTADESDAASEDKNGFSLTFNGPADRSLRKLVIDLGPTGLKFDARADLGFAFATGTKVGVKSTDVTATLGNSDTKLTLSFEPGALTTGRALNFGVDRDLISSGTGGNSADLLTGAKVKVQTKGSAAPGKGQGVLASQFGTGYSPAAGFGLIDAEAAVRSLLANPPPKAAGLTSGDLLVTNAQTKQIAEIRPDGTFVQLLPKLPDPTDGATDGVYRHPQEAVVDPRGNVAVLYDAFTLYLVTINPGTGGSTVLTAPNWGTEGSSASDGLESETVTSGPYVFATYTRRGDDFGGAGLLRFDPANNAVQAFGLDGRYTSVNGGPDGMIYALSSGYYAGPTPVDVYDPNTLTRVRTLNLVLGASLQGTPDVAPGKIAVGPAGEFYALAGDYGDQTLYKLGADGQRLAVLRLPHAGNNVCVNAKGEILVGALDPILVDPSFQTATSLSVYGAIHYTYTPLVTASFVP